MDRLKTMVAATAISVCISAGAEFADWPLDAETIPVPSAWVDYFGTHYTTEPGPWRTVRGYGGPHSKLPPVAERGKQRQVRIGPFAGELVKLSLSDFRNWKHGDAVGLDKLIPKLTQQDAAAVYVAEAGGKIGSRDERNETQWSQDTIYWLMRDVYGKFPGAAQHLFFQWGNEINGKMIGVSSDEWKKYAARIKAGESRWKFTCLPEHGEAYAENYFAPALEAVERASHELFNRPDRIPRMTGSFANIYNERFRQWMYGILDHKLDGRHASSFKGDPVWKHVDIITIHYPFAGGDRGGVGIIQEIWDRYGKTGKVKGLWITEEHGNSGKGPTTVVDRGLHFLKWAADNQLDATQTRLCWWGAGNRKPGGTANEAVNTLGSFLGDAPLRLAEQNVDQAKGYLVLADDEKGMPKKIMVAVVPDKKKPAGIGDLKIPLPVNAGESWSARAVQYSVSQKPEDTLPAIKAGADGLTITLNRAVSEPLVLMLERK
ncbi:MAG: hypothetical protein K9M45_01250 [Kiritimatiellales bacterium]|nr:hypothetical protein [Kiritimatiellales bacterium]